MLKIHYVFLLLVGVVLCLAILVMADSSHRALLVGSDFRGIFTGSYMIEHGARSHLYELRAQLYWQQQYVPEVHSLKALLPFLNPAFVALVLLPLTYLSFASAYVVWGMVNIVLFGFIFFWCFGLFREELQNAEGARTPLFLLIFSWIPFWVAIMQGQFSLILVLSLCASWTAYNKQQPFRAGLWLALLFVRPYLILVPAALFLITKQYRVLQGLLSGVAGLVGIGLLVGGVSGVAQYMRTLLFVGQVGDAFAVHPGFEPTLKSLLHALYGTNEVTTGILVTWFVVFILLFLYLYWWQRRSAIRPHIVWALIPLVGILASPHTNYHDLSLVFFSELIVFRFLLSTWGNTGWVEKYVPFWGYIFVTAHMLALWALLPLSAVTACVLLVCTLYLLYFEYRHESTRRSAIRKLNR